MKQGLSLRVSQHLALTPQLQQSIRLLQLSTLELAQEVEQMLGDNPFLELNSDEAPREEFGLDRADTPVPQEEREAEFTPSGDFGGAEGERASTSSTDADAAPVDTEPSDWEGEGSTEVIADDGEWGGEAQARRNNNEPGDDVEAADLARPHESLQDFLHRQALALRLAEEDRAALRFLIESLNDDGYLEDPLEELAAGLAPDDLEQQEELVHRFTVALRLLHHLDPPGVGARSLAECLTLQLKALQAECHDAARETALAICRHPMDLLARRVVNVERNVVVPDVLVTKAGRGNQVRFRVQLNPDVMPRLRVHDVYAGALKAHRGE